MGALSLVHTNRIKKIPKMCQVVPNMNIHSGAKCETLETTSGDITVKLSTISSELFLLPGRKYGCVSRHPTIMNKRVTVIASWDK